MQDMAAQGTEGVPAIKQKDIRCERDGGIITHMDMNDGMGR